jgi:DNA-binding transcriptional LysR family regulator
MRSVDPSTIQAFVCVADLSSFSRAAEALGQAQSTISLKVKRLEERLGRRLLERTPRSVRLSTDGQAFIGPARDLLSAYQRANEAFVVPSQRVVLGVSHHLVGPNFPAVLKQLKQIDPNCVFEVRVAGSAELIRDLDAGVLNGALMLRQEGDRREGEVVCRETLGWYAAKGFSHDASQPLPLATQAAPCGLRSLAVDVLEQAEIAWIEVFVGGGVAVLGSAIEAGLAIGLLVGRLAPAGVEEVTARLALPKLRPAAVILSSRTSDQRVKGALQRFCAAFRATSPY